MKDVSDCKLVVFVVTVYWIRKENDQEQCNCEKNLAYWRRTPPRKNDFAELTHLFQVGTYTRPKAWQKDYLLYVSQ